MRKTSIKSPCIVQNILMRYTYHVAYFWYCRWTWLCQQNVNYLILRQQQHRTKRESVPKFMTATYQLLHVKGDVLLQICFVSLCVRVLFSISTNVAFDVLLGTKFINRICRGTYPCKRKVVLWHSHSVAILSAYKHQKPASSQEAALICKKAPFDHIRELLLFICIAQ